MNHEIEENINPSKAHKVAILTCFQYFFLNFAIDGFQTYDMCFHSYFKTFRKELHNFYYSVKDIYMTKLLLVSNLKLVKRW